MSTKAKPTKPGAPAKPAAAPRKHPTKVPFWQRSIEAPKVREALRRLAPQVSLDAFQAAYEDQSLRRKAPWNSEAAVEARLAELRAKRAALAPSPRPQVEAPLEGASAAASEFLGTSSATPTD